MRNIFSVKQPSSLLKSCLVALTGFLVMLITSSFSSPAINADSIVGVWKTGEGTAMVRIYKNGDKYQGKIVWLKEPNDPETGKPKVDKNHPDEAVRSRPILGLINVWGFVHKGENVWDEGNIYDPKVGKEYSCKMKLKDNNTLEVRGFIGVSVFGRTDTWTRQVKKAK